jgi:hypothetical protein
MYDGTDVALVLGGLVSAVLAAVSLLAAVGSLASFVYQKRKCDGCKASFSGRLAAYFMATTLLCGISVASGYATYDIFEHQRGYTNPPTHVLAVAIASLWGPVTAGVLGFYCLRKGKRGRVAG